MKGSRRRQNAKPIRAHDHMLSVRMTREMRRVLRALVAFTKEGNKDHDRMASEASYTQEMFEVAIVKECDRVFGMSVEKKFKELARLDGVLGARGRRRLVASGRRLSLQRVS